MRALSFAACVALCALPAFGQAGRAAPPDHRPPGVRLKLERPREVALGPLNSRERGRLSAPERRLRTGVHRSLPEGALDAGAWEANGGSARLWRLAVRSQGSTGTRLELAGVDLGGGRLWLHSGDQTAGPYTGRGPFGDGRFWTPTFFGESVTLEYEPGPEAEPPAAPPFEIATLSHQAVDFLTPLADSATKDPADGCHLDPNCYPEWRDTMKMVAHMLFEDKGGRYVCSGALVNTRDKSRKPYFLTAGHCVNNEAAARSLEVYWTYQTSGCGAAPPASRADSVKSSQGASLISTGGVSEGDFSLLLLRDAPAGTLFADWDTADPPLGSSLTGVHHPAGSYKRISFGKRIADASVNVEGNVAPAERYIELLYDRGRIEHGSSGSPLFSGPGMIVGVASYAFFPPDGVCSLDYGLAGYGRLSNVYQHVRDFMENLPAAMVKPAPGEARFTVVNGAASPARQTVRLLTETPGEVRYKLRADAPWIRLSNTTGLVSASSPGAVDLSVDPVRFDQPGKYQSTVTIFSGAAEPQFINVFAEVRVDRSNVVATVTPGAERYGFKLRLEEKNGLAARITEVKLDGRDFTGSVQGWFGTTLIPARGALEATLATDYAYGPGDHYFEFRGVDEGTGRPWYVTTTVRF